MQSTQKEGLFSLEVGQIYHKATYFHLGED